MDIEKYLIFLKGKECTKDVLNIIATRYHYRITFNNHQTYTYRRENVRVYINPKILDASNHIVYKNNEQMKGIKKLLIFASKYCRLIYNNGYDEWYLLKDLVIEKSIASHPNSKRLIEYLKRAANQISITDEDENSFLFNQYNKLQFIPGQSLLSKIIHNDTTINQYKNDFLIFPFGFNISQKRATELAFQNQVSVIEGPPGTGKTQTILNIIANAIINNNTVAVVSNNNSALSNILEKLKLNHLDFICAFLGRKDNRDKFFEEQMTNYPDFTDWNYSVKKDTLVSLQAELNEMLKRKNELAEVTLLLKNFETEFEYFKTYYTSWNETISLPKQITKRKVEELLDLLIELQYLGIKGKVSLLEKIHLILKYGFKTGKALYRNPAPFISNIQYLYYQRQIYELKEKKFYLEKRINKYNFNQKIKEYKELSLQSFKFELRKRYQARKRPSFNESVLRYDFKSFTNEYPVILSTTHSLRNSMPHNFLFDYLIVDEASQVDLASGMLAFSCAKNAVIVGDTKQLPNIIPTNKLGYLNDLFQKYQLPDALNVANHSLITSIMAYFPNLPRTLLKEHYRCHPLIINFCNQKYYHNDMIILTERNYNNQPLTVYKTVAGNHARGRINQRQIDVITKEILPKIRKEDESATIGIISPYRDHVEELQRLINDPMIEIDTVHKFQGRERDIIILSSVANEINDFIDDPHLINVAVSRAVKQLIVVVSPTFEDKVGTNIGDLIRYIKYRNFEVIESEIYSAFDLLYSQYSSKLLEKFRNIQKVSEFQSENVINMIIEGILERKEFQTLGKIMHQPLRMTIKNPEKLNEEEYRYWANVLTHTDFLIYSKIDKTPILVVEVDGYHYHQNEAQKKRDQLKDQILQKYNIPYIRLRTNESGEEERIIKKLNNILNIRN